MIRKRLIVLGLSLLLQTAVYADNDCFENIDERLDENGYLNLYKCNMTDKDMPRLVDFIVANPNIKKLEISYSAITGKGAKVLAKAGLMEIYIDNNQVGDEGAVAFANNNTLELISISHNHITDVGVMALAQTPNLKELDVYDNKITDKSINALVNSRLEKLAVYDHQFTEEALVTLSQSKTITEFFLTGVTDKVVLAYARNNNIVRLGLFGKVTDIGAVALAKHKRIYELYLDSNQIGDRGAVALAENQVIQTLYLGSNLIGDEGAIALSKNQTLQWLDVSYNHIGKAGIDALRQNKNMRIECKGNVEGYKCD